jgi:hypothetical protein
MARTMPDFGIQWETANVGWFSRIRAVDVSVEPALAMFSA